MITLDPLLIAIIVIVVLVVLFSVTCIKIVPQAEAAIVERLGSYLDTWNNGLHVKVPFIDACAPTSRSKSRCSTSRRSPSSRRTT